LPSIELEFGLDRGGASFPYTATMIGFALGGVLMGRLVDRFGIAVPVIMAATMIGAGYVLSSFAPNFWTFLICQAVLIGMLGSSATFGPMVADVSHWFLKRRGLAIAIVASGNYLAGAIWPPILQEAIVSIGWRGAYFWVGVFCFCTMIPLALLLRRRPDIDQGSVPVAAKAATASAPVSPNVVLMLLVVAGIGCCVAMSMPQVHIVAYCGDLGYGPAVGAEMLSLMLGLGVISRLASGVIADKIGGVGTLILGSTLQCLALLFYLPFDGLVSLYLVSALFGLSQGGIVPSYALIVREYFPARQAGSRVGIVLMATVLGMALGGWMSGEIYDLTGSYQAAFLNGIAFNLLNMSIAFWLLYIRRPKGPRNAAMA
ncbi:MAG: MFS transporter, partial [Alphaproteobacteria bacterium]|nr:MFS transporter [Alphaproteobacteria bacterium]